MRVNPHTIWPRKRTSDLVNADLVDTSPASKSMNPGRRRKSLQSWQARSHQIRTQYHLINQATFSTQLGDTARAPGAVGRANLLVGQAEATRHEFRSCESIFGDVSETRAEAFSNPVAQLQTFSLAGSQSRAAHLRQFARRGQLCQLPVVGNHWEIAGQRVTAVQRQTCASGARTQASQGGPAWPMQRASSGCGLTLQAQR